MHTHVYIHISIYNIYMLIYTDIYTKFYIYVFYTIFDINLHMFYGPSSPLRFRYIQKLPTPVGTGGHTS